MKKSRKRIITFISLICIVLALIIALVVVALSKPLSYVPPIDSEVNDSNYASENVIDYQDGQFAWLKRNIWGNERLVLAENGEYVYFDDVDNPFRIFNRQIIFISEGKLKILDIDTKQTTVISECALKFVLHKTDIVYMDNNGILYKYGMDSKETQEIHEKVDLIYVYNDSLYIVDDYGWLTKIVDDGITEKIIKVSIERYPNYLMQQNNSLIYWMDNGLKVLNIVTGDAQSVDFGYDGSSCDLEYVCNDESIFLSFEALDYGGFFGNAQRVEHESNGLWRIDIETLEKEKLSDEIFESLYLRGEVLLGVQSNRLYIIDVITGEIIKIS